MRTIVVVQTGLLYCFFISTTTKDLILRIMEREWG